MVLPCLVTCLALIYGPKRYQTSQTPRHGYAEHGKCPSTRQAQTAMPLVCSRCTGQILAHTSSPAHCHKQRCLHRTHSSLLPWWNCYDVFDIFRLIFGCIARLGLRSMPEWPSQCVRVFYVACRHLSWYLLINSYRPYRYTQVICRGYRNTSQIIRKSLPQMNTRQPRVRYCIHAPSLPHCLQSSGSASH